MTIEFVPVKTSVVFFLCWVASAHGLVQEPQASEPPTNRIAEKTAVQIPGLLKVIPAKAWGVVTARNLNGIEKKIQTLQQQIDLPIPVSILWQLKSFQNIVEGMDDNGDAAVALIPPAQQKLLNGDWARHTVIFLPMLDRKAMLKALQPVKIDKDVAKVILRDQVSYAGVKDGFLILAADEALVRQVLADNDGLGSGWSRHQLARYRQNDLSLWLNLPALMHSKQVEELVSKWSKQGIDVRSWLINRSTAQLSLRLADEGLFFEFYFSGQDGTNRTPPPDTRTSWLTGLPAEDFVWAMGSAVAGTDWAKLVVDLLPKLLTQAGQVDAAKVAELTRAYSNLVAKVDSVSVSISPLLPGPMGLVGVTKVIKTRGAAKVFLSQVEAFFKLLKGGVFVDGPAKRMANQIEYVKKAEVIAGTSVDHLSVDLSPFEKVDVPRLNKVIGKDGVLLRLGVVSDRYVVITLGGGLARFQAVAKVVQSGKAPLADNASIKKSTAALPAGRFFESYLAVDQGWRLLDVILRAIDEPSIPVIMTKVDAPILEVGRTVDLDHQQVDEFIPIELIRAVKDAVIQVMMQPKGVVQPIPTP